MGSEQQSPKVLMFPWLAHGHIASFLELAKRLSERNFSIYICSTPANLNSIKKKIPQKYAIHIQLVELYLPSLPELPPHYHTTNGLQLHLHSTLKKAVKMSKPDFLDILKTIKPDLLIYEMLVEWAGAIASAHNIRAIQFFTTGATTCSYFFHLIMRPGEAFPFPAIKLTDFQLSMALAAVESVENEEKYPDSEDHINTDKRVIVINTSRELEGKYMDFLSELTNNIVLSVGALVLDPNIIGDDDAEELIDWLGKRDKFSTVFVSFGTEYFLKKEEIEEIAYGLELSGVNFIWIIRFPKGEEIKIEEELPEGFLERIGESGKVVDKWAPQAKILKHPSISGFVSHCGWNSLIESVDYGVPIIVVPMHLDQPINAKLVVELGVGMEVLRDEKGKLQRDEISKVIKDVVLGNTGVVLRKNIIDRRETLRMRSREEIDGVAQKLAEICGKS